jgi:hypothetical protein
MFCIFTSIGFHFFYAQNGLGSTTHKKIVLKIRITKPYLMENKYELSYSLKESRILKQNFMVSATQTHLFLAFAFP